MILGFDQLKITMFWAHYPSFTSIQLAKTKVNTLDYVLNAERASRAAIFPPSKRATDSAGMSISSNRGHT